MAEWVDLLDPDEAELRKHAPDVDHASFELLLARADPEGRVRPSLRGHGDYVFGLLLSAVLEPEEDRLYYQEIDLVISRDRVLTVRKTPPDGKPFDLHAFAEFGKQGVLALLQDSTNVDRHGYTPSERAVRPRLDEIFSQAKKKLFFSCFSS